jgi:hypothetical protein
MVTVDAGSLKQEVKAHGDGPRMDVDLARIDGRNVAATRSAECAQKAKASNRMLSSQKNAGERADYFFWRPKR